MAGKREDSTMAGTQTLSLSPFGCFGRPPRAELLKVRNPSVSAMIQLQSEGRKEGGGGGELCELEPGTGTPSTTPCAPIAEEEKVFPVQTTFNLPTEMLQEN